MWRDHTMQVSAGAANAHLVAAIPAWRLFKAPMHLPARGMGKRRRASVECSGAQGLLLLLRGRALPSERVLRGTSQESVAEVA
jgi:hypothetical protein